MWSFKCLPRRHVLPRQASTSRPSPGCWKFNVSPKLETSYSCTFYQLQQIAASIVNQPIHHPRSLTPSIDSSPSRDQDAPSLVPRAPLELTYNYTPTIPSYLESRPSWPPPRRLRSLDQRPFPSSSSPAHPSPSSQTHSTVMANPSLLRSRSRCSPFPSAMP